MPWNTTGAAPRWSPISAAAPGPCSAPCSIPAGSPGTAGSGARAQTCCSTSCARDRALDESERLLLNVLPAPVASRLKQSDQVIADGFPAATVLFADIVGFTGIAERLPPADVVVLLDRVFAGWDRLAVRHGVEKIKTIGDAYMVAGGVPSPRADHAEAIADMALEMGAEGTRCAAESGQALEVRIGIDIGPVVAGVIGRTKFIYDLWGDTVNTASRMESHGLPGAIQVTERAYERLGARYELRRRGRIEIKGKGPTDTYLLIGRKGKERGTDPRDAQVRTR
ncbi:MAG: adenylate/guanylate cyclase domain-containing protein [Gemmatimonadales bacterium]|nr:adenylate/guanylate cyclase domain-containing protein [Gemmatimonadales bacterium]